MFDIEQEGLSLFPMMWVVLCGIPIVLVSDKCCLGILMKFRVYPIPVCPYLLRYADNLFTLNL